MTELEWVASACIMFSCNPKPRQRNSNKRWRHLPESVLWGCPWQAAPMGGVTVSKTNPAPLLSTGPINGSDIRSARLQGKDGGGHREGKGTLGGEEVGRGGAAFAVFIGRAAWNAPRILWAYSTCPPGEKPIEKSFGKRRQSL